MPLRHPDRSSTRRVSPSRFAAGVALLVTSAAFAATTASPARAVRPDFRPAHRGTRSVFVEGDSLTVGLARYLPSALARIHVSNVVIDAAIGRHTSEGVADVALAIRRGRIAPHTPIVVALGTNDYGSPSAFARDVDALLSVAGARRVVWINLAFRGSRDTAARSLNAVLAARSLRMRVLDWHACIAAHPSWWAADGVHLTTAGFQARAAWIAAQLGG